MTFGYYDKTRFTGNLTWHPVLFKYMFGIKLDDIKMNGKSLGFCGANGKKKDCLLTVDSGTTMMSMPSWAFKSLPSNIPTASSPRDCITQADFGNLTWVINGHEYTFEPNEWIYPPFHGSKMSLG